VGDQLRFRELAREMDVRHLAGPRREPTALRTVADDDDRGIQVACCLDQVLVSLVIDQPADADHERLAVAPSNRRPPRGRNRVLAVPVDVDAVRDHRDFSFVGAQTVRGIHQTTAGGDHRGGASQAGVDERAVHPFEPGLAHHVGVIGGDDRPTAAGDEGRGLARGVGHVDVDQVGVDPTDPARQGGRNGHRQPSRPVFGDADLQRAVDAGDPRAGRPGAHDDVRDHLGHGPAKGADLLLDPTGDGGKHVLVDVQDPQGALGR
jgi:hypothetical protein